MSDGIYLGLGVLGVMLALGVGLLQFLNRLSPKPKVICGSCKQPLPKNADLNQYWLRQYRGTVYASPSWKKPQQKSQYANRFNKQNRLKEIFKSRKN